MSLDVSGGTTVREEESRREWSRGLWKGGMSDDEVGVTGGVVRDLERSYTDGVP